MREGDEGEFFLLVKCKCDKEHLALKQLCELANEKGTSRSQFNDQMSRTEKIPLFKRKYSL